MLAFASYVLIKQPKAGTVRANVIKEVKLTRDIRRAECYTICMYVYVRTFEMSLCQWWRFGDTLEFYLFPFGQSH